MSKRITPKSLNALGFIIMSLPSLRRLVLILKQIFISGLIYDTDTGKWKEQIFPIPSYIYDRSSFNEETNVEKAKSIIRSLHNRASTTF